MRSFQRYIVFLFVFGAAVACKQATGYHLPPKTMKSVLLDISVAEAYSMQVKDSLHRGGGKNYDSLAIYYGYIFDHYKITEDQFRQSMDWYKNHSTELDSLCTDLLPVIARWQSGRPGGK